MSGLLIDHDGHAIDFKDLEIVAFRLAINAFWDGLEAEHKLKAEKLYSSNLTVMSNYSCWRELAFIEFSHSLVKSEKFITALNFYESAYEQLLSHEPHLELNTAK